MNRKVKMAAALGVSVAMMVLAACVPAAPDAASQAVRVIPDAPVPAAGKPLETDDEGLALLRDTLLSSEGAFFCETSETFSGQGSRRVEVTRGLLEGIVATLLQYDAQVLEMGTSLPYDESIYISGNSGQTSLSVIIGKHGAMGEGVQPQGTVLSVQIHSPEEEFMAGYLFAEDEVYDEILAQLEQHMVSNTAQITGEYITLQPEGGGWLYDFAEGKNGLAMLMQGEPVGDEAPVYYLELLNPADGSLLHCEVLGTGVQWLEACDYGDYDLRLGYDGGLYRYISTADPKNTCELRLPAALAALVSPAQGGASWWYYGFDADPAHEVYVAANEEQMILSVKGEEIVFASADIATDEIENFDAQAATIQYNQPRILNGGKTLVASVYLQNGYNGQGQDWSPGLLVYDIPSGEKHWVYDVFAGMNPGFAYPGGTQIVGFKNWEADDTQRVPLRLDLATMQVTHDVVYPKEMSPNDRTIDYEYYVYNTTEQLPDGRQKTVYSISLGGEPEPVVTVVAARGNTFIRGMTEHYALFSVSGGAQEQYLVYKYR